MTTYLSALVIVTLPETWWWWMMSCRLTPPINIYKAIITSTPKSRFTPPPLEVNQCRVVVALVALAAALRQPYIHPGLDRLERHHARSDPTAPPRPRLPVCPASSEPHLNLPTSLNSAPYLAVRHRLSSRTRGPATAAISIGSGTGA